MPWKARKRGMKWCVYKEGENTPVAGGCHGTRAEADAHVRALYASEEAAAQGGITMTTNEWITTGSNGSSSNAVTLTLTNGNGEVLAEAEVGEQVEEKTYPRWEAVLAFEGLATSDRRYLMPGKISHRELPLSLMAQTVTSSEGHDGAKAAGNITEIWREQRPDLGEGVVAIMGGGAFADNEAGQEALQLVEDEMLRGVSIDFAHDEVHTLDPDTYEPVPDEELDIEKALGGLYLRGFSGEIMGATLVPFPAFGDAHMQVVRGEQTLLASAPRTWAIEGQQLRVIKQAPLTAAAAGATPLMPPRDWFQRPEPDVPTPLTVTDDGQVYGHIALWGQCHSGFEICEIAERSRSNYAYFHTGVLKTADGEEINVGRITVGEKGYAKGGHASIVLGVQGAIEHYDNTACVGAYVRARDGKLGIWVSGAVRSDCPAEKIVEMKANPPSGDWRYEIKSRCREMVAILCVPVGGFAIPRFEARVATAGHQDVVMALVATGYSEVEAPVMTRSDQRRFTLLKARAHEALEQ